MKQRTARIWLSLALIIGTLTCHFSRCVHAQVMNDRSEATCKANKAWLESCFARGEIARIPTGTLYVDDVVQTPVSVGCGRIEGQGSAGYWIPIGHQPLSTNVIDGKRVWFTSRIAQVTEGKPALRLRGVGFMCRDVWFEGQGDTAAIEVEGRNTGVASGHHRFENITFYNWKQCFKALSGYYKDGQFVKDENHADNTTASNCFAFNCDTIFRSENPQSANWVFRDWFHQGTTRNGTCVEFDIQRGGSVVVDGLVVENAKFTLFRLKDFSPNNSRLDARIWIDTMLDPKPNFCWVEYVGDATAAAWSEWGIDIRGFAGSQNIPIESHAQYKGCDKLPKHRWRVSIDHVKQGAK